MGILVVLLVAAWGLVLGPALLQSANSPMNTERMFRRSLRALGGRRTRPPVLGGRNILVPPKPAYPLHGGALTPLGQPLRPGRLTAAERRRRNLTFLAVFIIATFAIGLVPQLRFVLIFNLIADVCLILYLGLAVYLSVWPPQSERSERRPQLDPALATQRAAEGL